MEVPDPEAVTAEAVRLRADPAAAQASYDRLNDPDVLEAIAGHLRTLLKAAELAQIAKQFKQDPGGDVLEARKAYENAINVALGTEKKREHGADDITDQKA